MAHHADPSSATRIAIPVVPASQRTPPRREAYADQGTLIMDADNGIEALAAAQAIVASRAPASVRPPVDSLPEIVFERTGISHPGEASSARPRSKKIDSSLVMMVMGAIAMIAAVASISQMKRPVASAPPPAKVAAAAAQPVAAPPAAPPAAPMVAPPVATPSAEAIDVDDVAPPPAPLAPAKPAVVTKHAAAGTPVVAKAPEKKAPAKAATDDKKTLEQLLDELGEEQLKR